MENISYLRLTALSTQVQTLLSYQMRSGIHCEEPRCRMRMDQSRELEEAIETLTKTTDKEIRVCEVGDLELNAEVSKSFISVAKLEYKIAENYLRFEWNELKNVPHTLIGLKSGSLLSK